eukprot:TRINITY_DN3642_c0_g1_i9.p1 TRINITY_DN3642_c0_g1~~TRINITY_DN3642_c0_g1_i9.p1  ORF type:complete len:242 (+),score=77.31 TRINITY_DN3642_c0_g1_i9:179-904(+)
MKGDEDKENMWKEITNVSVEFEKVYTGVNRCITNTSDGRLQISSACSSLKKKLVELKHVLCGKLTNAQNEIAERNAKILQLQDDIKELAFSGVTGGIKEKEEHCKILTEEIKQLKTTLTPLPHKALICRGLVGGVDMIGQVIHRLLADQHTTRDSITSYIMCIVEKKRQIEAKKKKDEDKSTIARMLTSLLKCGGPIVEIGLELGMTIPDDFLEVLRGVHSSSPSSSSSSSSSDATSKNNR